MSKMGVLSKKRIKELVSDIKKGYLYIDRTKDSDTHALPKMSTPKRIIWSKSHSTIDRLTYAIYPPEEYKDPITGNTLIVINVVILSCKDHKVSKERNYSEGSE